MRWFLSLHAPSYKIALSPEKAPRSPDDQEEASQKTNQATDTQTQESEVSASSQLADRAQTPDLSSVPPVPDINLKTPAAGNSDTGPLPPPFTPSINQTLNMQTDAPAPLPESLTPAIMRSRLDGKKKIK